MRRGLVDEGAATLRMRQDPANDNYNMFDLIAYRIKFVEVRSLLPHFTSRNDLANENQNTFKLVAYHINFVELRFTLISLGSPSPLAFWIVSKTIEHS